VMAVSALGEFLMLGMGKYRRLWFFGFVFFGLQRHLRRTFIGGNNDAGNAETDRYKNAHQHFSTHNLAPHLD
jgi:hypothetical protein